MAEKAKQSSQNDAPSAAIIDEKTIQLVIAHLGKQNFGAAIDQVQEVIRYKKITEIPDAPPFVAGIASIHGEMALVIDLARYFSISQQPNEHAKHIIVVRYEKELYGLLVDEVSQIIRVSESNIKDAPSSIQQKNRDYISGIYVESEEHVIMIFNLTVILSKNELTLLDEVKQQHLEQQTIKQTNKPLKPTGAHDA